MSPRPLDLDVISAVLARSPLPTVCLDASGAVTRCNPAARPLLEWLAAALPRLRHGGAAQLRVGEGVQQLRLQPLRDVHGRQVGSLVVALSAEHALPPLCLADVAEILADTWATLDALASVSRCLNG